MKSDSGDKGLVIVYTGNGKGKTTSALGICLRAVGHGRKVAIIQFIKSDWEYGEIEALKMLSPRVRIDRLGAGCIGIMGDDKPIEEHKKAAQHALQVSLEAVSSGLYDIVILDEINIALHKELITIGSLLSLIKGKPFNVDLVLTGRYADPAIIDAADLVTEMKEIKHPFQKGIPARKGIDY